MSFVQLKIVMPKFNVLIIGAGAAGLMCAHIAGKRGRSVLLLDDAKKPADKIRSALL